jgi:hypothetical protein
VILFWNSKNVNKGKYTRFSLSCALKDKSYGNGMRSSDETLMLIPAKQLDKHCAVKACCRRCLAKCQTADEIWYYFNHSPAGKLSFIPSPTTGENRSNYPLNRKLAGSQSPSGRLSPFFLRRIKLRLLGCRASSVVTILTELSRLI